MKTVNVLQRGYKTAPKYGKKKIGGKSDQIDERYVRATQNDLYLRRDGVTTTMNDLSQVVIDRGKQCQVPALPEIQ